MTGGITCQETAGFLFAHGCKHPATAACSVCGKAICGQHMGLSAAGMPTCIGCRPTTPGNSDDPYTYADSEYTDYHAYDPYDRYTRADRPTFESGPVTETGDEWESDLDAS